MKKNIPFIITCLLFILASKSNAQDINVYPGQDGIWVEMKAVFKKGDAIAISRQAGEGAWKDVTTIEAARSFEVFKGRYRGSSAPVISNSDLEDSTLETIWKHYNMYGMIDSLGEYRFNFNVLEALGAAFFDNTADKNRQYTYKANLSSASETIKTSKAVKFPASIDNIAVINPSVIKATNDGVYMEFEIADKGTMHSCRVYRSYYMRTGYEKITPVISFTKRGRKLIAIFTDRTALPKVLYSYIIKPIDIAGNEGMSSKPAKLFNVPANVIPPSVRHLKTVSDEKENAVRLSWSLPANADVVSVDIYRSKSYSGAYERIGSVNPRDTVYLDYKVEPVVSNFYTVALNGSFEQSVNSPRVPGTLKANRKNYAPPRDFTAILKGNIVYLTWLKNEADTRGYRIYRGEGYNAQARLIHPLIATRDSFVTYRDTLPVSGKPVVYSYEITDENTSYEESPHSAKVSIQYMPEHGPDHLPVVTNVTVVPAEKGGLQIMWSNLSQDNNGIESYTVYKRVADATGREEQSIKAITNLSKRTNFFFDNDVKDGYTYYYSVKASDIQGEGTNSSETGYTIPMMHPMNVNNIQGYAHATDILLKWTTPIGQPLNAIHVLRATNGKTPEEIAKLDPVKDSYTDKNVSGNTTYHYFFITENASGNKSERTSALSVTTAE